MFKSNNSLNKYIIDIYIIVSFIMLSLMSIFFIWCSNKIYFTGDSAFHLARLKELLDSKYIFPRYALNSFNSVGSIVMTMYPYLFLYPMIFIFHIVGSIKVTLYITFICGTFLTLLISYYSSLNLTRNKFISYIFALIYSLSYEFTNMYFSSSVIGVYFSAIVMPLVIFGFVYYIKYNKWLMLSIGMSLMLFSSVITFIFLIGLLLIWLILNIKFLNKERLMNLFKSALLTICTTSIMWLPIVKVVNSNKLRILNNDNIQTIGLLHIIFYSIIPKASAPAQSLTIYSLMGAFIGIIFIKKFSYLEKQMYFFSLFIILICTPIFPWGIFKGNFVLSRMVRNIQMTCRILVFPQVILEFILAIGIVKYLHKYKLNIKKLLIAAVIIIICILQLGGQGLSLRSKGINKQINNSVLLDDGLASKDPGYHYDYFPKALTNKDINNLRNHKSSNNVHFYSQGNGKFTFNTSKYISKIYIPFLYYKNVNYKDRLDDKIIRSKPNVNRLMTIYNVKKGHHNIRISMPLTKVDIISRIITLLSLLIYIKLIVKYFRRKSIRGAFK